jgi:hypothetical protein
MPCTSSIQNCLFSLYTQGQGTGAAITRNTAALNLTPVPYLDEAIDKPCQHKDFRVAAST